MENFSGKKVAVLGFGLEGKDLCSFLLQQKASITVFDEKENFETDKDYQNFKKEGVIFLLGSDSLKNGLQDFEIVFRSPGFKYLSPVITEALKNKVKISSATKLFFELCKGRIIGVTGTKGKGTTSTLIAEILKNSQKKVFLAGNVGQPMLSLLPNIDEASWVVLELSSFQLEDLAQGPYIAVILFIASEHLDHHQNQQEYIEAKANLVKYQNDKDMVVLNDDDEISSSFAKLTKAKVFSFSSKIKTNGAYVQDKNIYLFDRQLGETNKLQILGQHNWQNVCAAATAASLAGADFEAIQKTIFAFKGLEHRLEFVRNFQEIDFYNDSFSTTPETAIAAIDSFQKPIVLIAGGSDKGSDFKALGQKITNSSVKTLILIGLMALKIRQAVEEAGFKGKIIFQPSKEMKAIVNLASQEAKTGEAVLLSPACASFDLFANYKDRGLQFKENVKAL